MLENMLTKMLEPKLKEIKNAISTIAKDNNCSNAVIMIYNRPDEFGQPEAVIQFMGVDENGNMFPLVDKETGKEMVNSITELPKLLA